MVHLLNRLVCILFPNFLYDVKAVVPTSFELIGVQPGQGFRVLGFKLDVLKYF